MSTLFPAVSFRNRWRRLHAWSVGGCLIFFASLVAAQQNVSFEASIDTKEVIAGMPFELTFSLKNAEGTRFSPPPTPGFRSSGISEMRGMSIVNGRSSSNQSWSMQLVAARAGAFVIGPATVYVGGKALNTKPMTINVIAPGAGSKSQVNIPPGSDDRVFIAAEFEPKEVFVGQQVTWRIRLYTQLSVEGYDLMALPDFEGFFTKEKIRFDKRVEYVSLKGKKYAVRTLHEEAAFAQEAGEKTIGPARVSVGIEMPGASGFLFGPKPVTLQTQPVSITVKPLPQPIPEGFSGGVGAYAWELKADTNALSTDDALTLVVEIKGNGDGRRFAAPKIAVPAGCEIFEPRILEEEEYEAETEMLHRKKLEYVVLPKDTGLMVIRPAFTYFNLDSNRYVQVQGAEISFRVSAGKNFHPNDQLTETNPETPSDQSDAGWWGQSFFQRFASPWLWLVLVVPVLALAFFLFLRNRKAQQRPEPAPIALSPKPVVVAPRPTTPGTHQQHLQEAARRLNAEDPTRFYAELFKGIQAWLVGKYQFQTAQLNDVDISSILLRRGASPIRVQALLSVWHACEQAIYGGQAPKDAMESDWQLANQVMNALELETKF